MRHAADIPSSRDGFRPGRMALLSLACALATWIPSGCTSTPVPHVPEAVQESRRLAEQAGRLQTAGQWKAGAQWWARAAQEFQLLNQSSNVALAWHNEALCRAELEEIPVAHRLLTQALALNRDAGRTEEAWRQEVALLQWTDPAQDAGRLEELGSRVARGERPVSPHLGVVLDYELARARFRRGDATAAWAGLAGLEERFRVLGDPSGAATATVLRARVSEAVGDHAAAVSAWRSALQAFEVLALPRGIAVSLAGLGIALGRDPATGEESRRLLERAEANYRALGMNPAADAVAATWKK